VNQFMMKQEKWVSNLKNLVKLNYKKLKNKIMENISTIGNGMDFGVSFNNFSPEDIQVEETINAVFVVDVSPSISRYNNELNTAFNEFVQEMQKSHIADRLFVSTIEFCEKVDIKTGFQPIVNIPQMNFTPKGHGTALYDAVEKSLDNALTYRKNLEDTGINTKTLVFILTDGMDNSSRYGAHNNVKQKIKDFTSNEKNTFSFTSIMFGIGIDNKQYYEEAKDEMGIQHLACVGVTSKEIRKMIDFISSSISTTSNGKAITNVSF
jgi:uncharacterized protein YegL